MVLKSKERISPALHFLRKVGFLRHFRHDPHFGQIFFAHSSIKEMSATGLASTNQGSSFFINVASVQTGVDTLDATGTAITPAGMSGAYAAGALVVRSLGKTIRVPAQGSTGTSQRILRKVQRFDPTCDTTVSAFPVTNGFVGFNEGVGGADNGVVSGYETFYIEASGGIASGAVAKFARLS